MIPMPGYYAHTTPSRYLNSAARLTKGAPAPEYRPHRRVGTVGVVLGAGVLALAILNIVLARRGSASNEQLPQSGRALV